MITLAIQSSKGEIEANPYEKGMAFQETIQKRTYVKEQGIDIQTSLRYKSSSNQVELLVNAQQQGVAITDLKLRIELRRPADQAFDRECVPESLLNGKYLCTFTQLPQGLYFISLLLGESGRVDQELMLLP